MKKSICIFVVALLCGALSSTAHAAVIDWQKGVSVYPHAPGDFGSAAFQETAKNLKAMGANSVTFIVPIYQTSKTSSDVFAGGDTPSDAALSAGISYVHSLGMKAVIKVHVETYDGSNWRALINASDRDEWFKSYGGYLNHLGDIGKVAGLNGIVMGAEMISMATYTSNADNTERWQKMIADLRTHFGGYLTYDANWSWSGPDSAQFEDEIFHIGFWASLDYIGVSAYYPLGSDQANPPVSTLVGSWQYWDQSQLSGLHAKYGKPLLFTEVGYASVSGSHNSPCCTFSGSYDPTEQANDYEALFEYWNNSSYLSGVSFWVWDVDPNYGGPGNTDYTAQNKPAAQVIQTWFGGGGSTSGGTTGGGTTGGGTTGGNTGGTGSTPSQVSGSFSGSATASTLAAGQSSTLNVTVNSSGQASNVVSDIEIYDASGKQLFQKFYDGQSISNSAPGHYSISWTPPANGTYSLRLGVFNSDWSTMYFWNNDLLTLNVGSTGTTTSGGTAGGGGTVTGPAVLDVWWPGDGTTVQGLQPFKAMVENRTLADYTMYWQVDGDQLNAMADNQTDSPHKEALVNLQGWTWKGTGPYAITFVAKDSAGAVIAQKTVNITIVQ